MLGEMERIQYEGKFLPLLSPWKRTEGAALPSCPQRRCPWLHIVISCKKVLYVLMTGYFLDVLKVKGRVLVLIVASHRSTDEYHGKKMIFTDFCIIKT